MGCYVNLKAVFVRTSAVSVPFMSGGIRNWHHIDMVYLNPAVVQSAPSGAA